MRILPRRQTPLSFTSPSLFVHLWEEIEAGHKKGGPVSGAENGPFCFTRGPRGRAERKTGRTGENSGDR